MCLIIVALTRLLIYRTSKLKVFHVVPCTFGVCFSKKINSMIQASFDVCFFVIVQTNTASQSEVNNWVFL